MVAFNPTRLHHQRNALKSKTVLTVFAFAFLYQILVFHVAMTGFAEEPGPES